MKPERTWDIAVVGASSAVGETLIALLEERHFPLGKIYALASEPSEGSSLLFRGKPLRVEDLAAFDFSKVQLAMFSAAASVSAAHAPRAAAAGCVVIDNSSQFGYDDNIPLVIPEVNPEAIARYKNRNIIASPACATIQMLMALKPIYDTVGIERINVCTYQAVSGSGKEAIEELAQQTARLLNGQPVKCKVYPRQIAFNVLPHIDEFQENGYTREEMKMLWETQKILNDKNIQVNATCVRVPVFYGHSEALHIETREKISAERARKLLSKAPGVRVMDKREAGTYPTPVADTVGEDAVFVGRIREDLSHPRGLNLWVVSDNLRKGAALNTIQIAEELLKSYLN